MTSQFRRVSVSVGPVLTAVVCPGPSPHDRKEGPCPLFSLFSYRIRRDESGGSDGSHTVHRPGTGSVY